MRCDEFETRLNETLDARRNPADDRRLARHLDACRNCRQLAAAMDVVGESLRWSERPEPSEGLADKVLAQVASAPRPAADKTWSVWTHATLAAAVALLVMIVLPQRQSPEHQRPMVANTNLQPTEALARIDTPEMPAAPVGQLAREATSRYATLARNTSESLSEVWSLWQTREGAVEAVSTEPLLAEMAAGLRPLADSTTGAMDFLFNLLPQGEAAPHSPPATSSEPAAGQAAT